jgi:uncharacterized protein
MARAPKNPFKFGSPVEGEYYFPLPEFSNAVRTFLDSQINVVLIGPRRFGKTSFVLDIIRQEEGAGKVCLLVDIFNITSLRDFFQLLVRAFKSKQTFGQKLENLIKTIPRLKPVLTAETDDSGNASFSLHPDLSSEKDVKELILDTLLALGKLGEKVIVVIDEFQKISQLEDGGWLEGTIRTQMQRLNNTVFLFSGSRKSLIYDMFNNPSRPFYKTCQMLEIPLPGLEFTYWIIQKFKSVGITCDKQAIDKLRSAVQDTPNYIQMACFHLVAEQNVSHVDQNKIDDVLRTIVKQNAYAFETILNSLTPLQQRVLRLCANEQEEIYNKDLIAKYEITSGAALATSIKSLKEKGIIEEGSKKGRVTFDDPLFAIWLRTEFSY